MNRNFCFTLNNYSEEDYNKIINYNYKYLIIGKEIGKDSNTPHLQGYIEFATGKRLTTLKKHLGDKIHWEARMGTAIQARDYCKKDKDFKEFGEISKQGYRTDLKSIKEKIINGERAIELLINDEIDIQCYNLYKKTFNDIEDYIINKKERSEPPIAIWYWGATGSGKSYRAHKEIEGEVYHYISDRSWWDGYTGQETVIFDDYRGELPYNIMLQMLDRYNFKVTRRGRAPINFTSKKVIFTSSLPPEKIYKHRMEEDNIAQLLRRLTVTEVLQEGNTRLLGE